jgi:hypothetical protein
MEQAERRATETAAATSVRPHRLRLEFHDADVVNDLPHASDASNARQSKLAFVKRTHAAFDDDHPILNFYSNSPECR